MRVIPDNCRPCIFRHENPLEHPDCRSCDRFLNDSRYAKKWGACQETPSSLPPSQPEVSTDTGGVGTELATLLESLGVNKEEGKCGCATLAKLMDSWGIQECIDTRDEIVEWIRGEAQNRGWGEILKAAMKSMLTGVALRINIFDIYGSLVDEAIRRAKEKSAHVRPHSSDQPGQENGPPGSIQG